MFLVRGVPSGHAHSIVGALGRVRDGHGIAGGYAQEVEVDGDYHTFL